MTKFISWLVWSSENPDKFSLTLKGAVATILPVALLLSQQLGFTLDSSHAEAFVLSLVTILTTLATLIGLIRKLVNTFTSKEVVVFTKTVDKSAKKVAKKKSK